MSSRHFPFGEHDYSRYTFQPLLLGAVGGFALQVMLLLRALLIRELGFLPPSLRCFGLDYAADAPRSPQHLFPDISKDVWAQAELTPGELYLMKTDVDLREIAQRIRRGDADVAWLAPIAPVQVLEEYGGGESAQIPALCRFFLCFSAYAFDAFTTPWPERIREQLRELKPEGEALHALTKLGVTPSAIVKTPARAVNIIGAEGGTGNGSAKIMAATQKLLAAQLGLDLKIDGVVITGHYRPRNGHEARKDGLAHALDLDLTEACAPNCVTEFPLSAEMQIRVEGKLFDNLLRDEAHHRFEHDDRAVLAAAARLLRYSYFTRAGFERQKDLNNSDMYPALRTLGASPGLQPSSMSRAKPTS